MFKNLRDGNINPKEVLKDQMKFKSDLGGIEKGNKNSRSKNQISVIKNVENFLFLGEKIIDFFRDYCFCYLRLNTKQNMESVSKY